MLIRLLLLGDGCYWELWLVQHVLITTQYTPNGDATGKGIVGIYIQNAVSETICNSYNGAYRLSDPGSQSQCLG